MKFLLGLLAITAVVVVPEVSVANDEGYAVEESARPRPRRRVEWECAANNTRRSGPYYGYGPTERSAQHDALSQCRNESVFPCWPVPGSCIETY